MLALILVSAVLAGCSKQEQSKAEDNPKPVVAVRLAKAEQADVNTTVTASAAIFARQQASVAARITAPILELKARKGDRVAAGQVLARLEDRDALAQQRELRAAVDDAQGTQASDIERGRGQLAVAEASLNQADKTYNRRKQLFAQGAIPERDLLVSQTEFETAKANQEVAKKALDLLQKQSGVAQSRLEQARARLANSDAQLSYTEVRSPFAGVITEQFSFPGDMAKSDSPIFVVADLSVVVARAQVAESKARELKRGQNCSFHAADHAENGPNSFKGRLTVINGAVDPARRTVEVWCEIPNGQGVLRAAAFGELEVITGVEKNRVIVPQTAVQLKEGTREGWVMVVDAKNIAHKQPVVAGEFFDGKAPITKGLKGGETVVADGAYGMDDGMEVKEKGTK